MLVLTRRVGETVVIGSSVTVTVLGVKGSQVRIGVEAPRNVAVDREEVHERKRQEARSTANARPLSRRREDGMTRGVSLDGPGAVPSQGHEANRTAG